MNSGFTKEEVLGLHLLSEEEQYDWLNKHSVLKIGLNHCTLGVCEHNRAETLPELAFRLVQKYNSKELFDIQYYYCREVKLTDTEYRHRPIHQIAALLARLENEK